jgi:hypothetical protein
VIFLDQIVDTHQQWFAAPDLEGRGTRILPLFPGGNVIELHMSSFTCSAIGAFTLVCLAFRKANVAGKQPA